MTYGYVDLLRFNAIPDEFFYFVESFIRTKTTWLERVLSMGIPPVWRQAIITVRPR